MVRKKMTPEERAEARRLTHEKAMLICHRLNLPRILCECAFGESHPSSHRIVAGAVFMTIGVSIAKYGGHLIPIPGAEFIADWTGYLVHGAGSVPMIDIVLRKMRAET